MQPYRIVSWRGYSTSAIKKEKQHYIHMHIYQHIQFINMKIRQYISHAYHTIGPLTETKL